MARTKKTIDDKIDDLNLVPIMNLVVCLIPIVLVGASMVKVGVINVNTKVFGPATVEPPGHEVPLNLTVAVADDGFHLAATGANLPDLLGTMVDSQAEAPTVHIPKSGETYDHARLYTELVKIKNAHPDETILMVSADPRVPYRDIVAVMDVSRQRLEADSYDSADGLQAAMVRYDQGRPSLLWPDVLFTVAN